MPNRQSITGYALNVDGETKFSFYHFTLADATREGQLLSQLQSTVLEK